MTDERPTAATYVEWARAQGCVVGMEPVTHHGQAMIAISIWAPSGHGALEIVLEPEERLASTTVARLDRRLGMKSRLFT